MLRRYGVLVLTIGAATGVAWSAVAGAQQYPPASGNLTVEITAEAPGGAVHVSGTGCTAGSTVDLSFDTSSAGTANATNAGAFTATVTVPSSASTGTHTITSQCPSASGGFRVLAARVTVSRTLPRTGSNAVVPLLMVSAGLLGVGAVLVATLRTRRSS